MSRPRALLLALIVTVLWSTSFLLIKLALVSVGPVWLTFLRYEFAALVLAAVSRKALRRAWREIGPARLAVFGVLGYALAQTPFIYALSRLPASTTLLIGAVFGALAVTALGAAFLG
ncbi:MAG: EamA family transporter, partial [Candidatus Limnocylindria bacterium]